MKFANASSPSPKATNMDVKGVQKKQMELDGVPWLRSK